MILEFNESTYRVTEGGEANVTVVRRGASDVPRSFSVMVNSQDGTATGVCIYWTTLISYTCINYVG